MIRSHDDYQAALRRIHELVNRNKRLPRYDTERRLNAKIIENEALRVQQYVNRGF
jgi:antitoxin component HigA of HigAB toxin-antitoxin module